MLWPTTIPGYLRHIQHPRLGRAGEDLGSGWDTISTFPSWTYRQQGPAVRTASTSWRDRRRLLDTNPNDRPAMANQGLSEIPGGGRGGAATVVSKVPDQRPARLLERRDDNQQRRISLTGKTTSNVTRGVASNRSARILGLPRTNVRTSS